MAYCTQADIEEVVAASELIQLTDDAGAAVDADRVERAVADADATVDAYCQGRYAIPLTPVPDKIRQVSVDIAVYNLYARRGDAIPELRKDRYREALRFLERAAEGKILLGTATPAQRHTAQTPDIDSADRRFTRTKLQGF